MHRFPSGCSRGESPSVGEIGTNEGKGKVVPPPGVEIGVNEGKGGFMPHPSTEIEGKEMDKGRPSSYC